MRSRRPHRCRDLRRERPHHLPRLGWPLGGPRPHAGRHPGGVRRRPGPGPAVLRRAARGPVAGGAQRRPPRPRTPRGRARRRPAGRHPERRRPPRAGRFTAGAPHPRAAALGVVHAAATSATTGTARLADEPAVPHCGAPALRPDIVWFGEIPYGMDLVEQALDACDLFVSIGTSGVVYPAAALRPLGPRRHPRAQPRAERRCDRLRRVAPRPGHPPGAGVGGRAARLIASFSCDRTRVVV